jgi:hypothetical protein
LFDKVAVVIMGSASTWFLGSDWDDWRIKATQVLRASGIAVFDFSSHIQRLVKDKGIHLVKTDDALCAFAEYTVLIQDYMTACIPILLSEFAERWDIVDENGKWAPVFNGTKLEFPTCKFAAPPPPSGAKATAIIIIIHQHTLIKYLESSVSTYWNFLDNGSFILASNGIIITKISSVNIDVIKWL